MPDAAESALFAKFQGRSSGYFRIANLGDRAIQDQEFGFGFTPLTLTMHVDGFGFVGVEHHDQAEVLVTFGHGDGSLPMVKA